MKVGQMMALYGEHFFPKEVVKALKALNEDSPPLDWEAIAPIIQKRLSPEQMELLEIDRDALAAASMGQVHKATIKQTGEVICLKIQYPGVSKAIDNDIKALKSMLTMLKVIPKNSSGFEDMLSEVRTMLRHEVDYERELSYTDVMYGLLKDDSRFVVPKTYPQFSSKKLIATSFEEGVGIDSKEVDSLNQDRKHQLAESYAFLFLAELFDYGLMQTDPHFGNYKIRIDQNGKQDQIILLDFGAIRKFPKTFLHDYKSMLKGIFYNRREESINAATKVGYLAPDDSEKLHDQFWKLTQLVIEPWLHKDDPRANQSLLSRKGHYLWAHSDLPSRVTKMGAEYALTFKMRPPPKEVVFLDRKIGGVFIVLKTLEAQFDGHQLMKSFLEN